MCCHPIPVRHNRIRSCTAIVSECSRILLWIVCHMSDDLYIHCINDAVRKTFSKGVACHDARTRWELFLQLWSSKNDISLWERIPIQLNLLHRCKTIASTKIPYSWPFVCCGLTLYWMSEQWELFLVDKIGVKNRLTCITILGST